jgi:RNA polymerase sigma-70 factor (ECF subfamily)
MDSVRYIVGSDDKARPAAGSKGLNDTEIRGLVQKAVAGDIEAFGELYGVYIDRIYRFVFYQVNNRTVAEDLTEEVFLKAWNGIGRYRWQGQPFTAWLYRIARNHVIDYFRTSRQHDILEEALPADSGNPEDEAEDRLTQKVLAEAISCLPEQQQQVVIMKFIEGLDNREIEELMGKSQGAIRILQMRALAGLRRTLNGGA